MADLQSIAWLWSKYLGRKGFIVDVGAFNGIGGSLSRQLLDRGGWPGIVIDPLPSNVKGLHVLYDGRDDITIVPAAISNESGVGNLLPCGMVSTLSERWAELGAAWFEKVNYGPPISVRLATLAEVLEECNAPQQIDVLKTDAEGYDFQVLQGMDWEKYTVDTLIVETAGFCELPVKKLWQPKPDLLAFLDSKGFKHVHCTTRGNAWFLPKDVEFDITRIE